MARFPGNRFLHNEQRGYEMIWKEMAQSLFFAFFQSINIYFVSATKCIGIFIETLVRS